MTTARTTSAILRRSVDDSRPIRAGRVSVDRIRVHPHHIRELGDITELAANIRVEGIHQALTLQRRGDQLELIDGLHRWAAARAAGLRTVPAVIHEARPDAEVLSAMVTTDIHKRPLTPQEKAVAIEKMVRWGFTRREIAERWGISEATVYNWQKGGAPAAESKQAPRPRSPRRRPAAVTNLAGQLRALAETLACGPETVSAAAVARSLRRLADEADGTPQEAKSA